ncbi:MAG: biotin/lipoate A/B protein ligase family protein [Phycisphaerae bacterium]
MTLRVIHDPPQTGAVNMAADGALLEGVGAGASPPTLRFYRWDPPTISLGYFQKYADFEALEPPAGDLAVVRRQTGGGAILHDQELTYSLTLPADHPLLIGGPNRLYERAHDAIMDCLARAGVKAWRGCPTDDSTAGRGPFFCFARRHTLDVLVGDQKLVGSAQRRTPTAVLQHGSIILGQRFTQQPTAHAAGLDACELADRFTQALCKPANITTQIGDWTQDEIQVIQRLTPQHTSHDWLHRL